MYYNSGIARKKSGYFLGNALNNIKGEVSYGDY
jgi:hypothetical protein